MHVLSIKGMQLKGLQGNINSSIVKEVFLEGEFIYDASILVEVR